MKNYCTLLLLVISSINSFSQENNEKQEKVSAKLYFLTGVDFIQSDSIRTVYGTKTKQFIGGGIEISDRNYSKVRLNAQLSYSTFTNIKNGVITDTITTIKFFAGFVLPLYENNTIIITTKFGVTFTGITETNYKIEKAMSTGVLMGFGIEKKLFTSTRMFSNLSYQYQKLTPNYIFRDFDMLKLSFGIIF